MNLSIRYGIRVNPKEWLQLVTGDGGPETATIVMVLCKFVILINPDCLSVPSCLLISCLHF